MTLFLVFFRLVMVATVSKVAGGTILPPSAKELLGRKVLPIAGLGNGQDGRDGRVRGQGDG